MVRRQDNTEGDQLRVQRCASSVAKVGTTGQIVFQTRIRRIKVDAVLPELPRLDARCVVEVTT